MSLINKMLQDLEQRTDAATKNEPLAGDVRAVPANASARARLLAGLLVLGIAVLVLMWIVLQPRAALAPLPAPASSRVATPPASSPSITAASSSPAVTVPVPALAKTSSPAALVAAAPVTAAPARLKPFTVAAAPVRPETEPSPAVTLPVVKKPSTVVMQEAAAEVEQTAAAAASVAPSKSPKRFSPQQQSDNAYKQAIAQVQQGREHEAKQSLRRALETSPGNAKARHMLAGLLVEGNALNEASSVLREGLKLTPGESAFSMALARLQLESGESDNALNTLEQGLPAAGDEPQYHAFYAHLMQRAKRHAEAIQHYVVALRSDPAMPSWLLGIGISLQAQGQDNDAAQAFRRARDSGLLSAQLLQFVDERLNQLK